MSLFRLQKPEPDLEEEDNSIEGERALTPVNNGIRLQNRITNWAVMLGAVALAGVLLYKYYAGVYHEYKATQAPARDSTRTVTTATLPPLTMPEPVPVKQGAPTEAAQVLPPLQPSAGAVAAAGGAASPSAVETRPVADIVRERRLKRELRFSLDGSSGAVATPSAADAESGATGVIRAGRASHPSSGTTGHPDDAAAARAYLLPDPTLMMTRGRVIPCTLLPAIDTTLTGMVSCTIAEDVTGADNKVVLLDRGTVCTGQQGGGITHGRRRVGIIWQRCETPEHVLVPVDAGAVDSLGRPGIPGAVDSHFWDRFGAAIAVSLISDVGPYLTATRQGGSNNTTVAFPSITGPQDVMTEVLKGTASIPPTITAAQGARALIYLAGDIDFRDVYQLERVK